jgi:uncharacterized repeat protein (TIGR01451 family)
MERAPRPAPLRTALFIVAFVALAALGSVERVECATCPGFATAVNYAAGDRTQAVAAADFNRDGKPDLAATNALACTVSIFLGNGDGTFMAANHVNAMGCFATSIAAGDINRDGKPDLVTANLGSVSVSILLGDGTGGFAVSTTLAPNSPYSVALGDVNGDAKPDLAVGSASSVSILLGNGNGTFGAAVSYAVGMVPYSVAIGDVNRDGAPDLAVANRDSDNVSVLLGTGTGTFGSAVNYGIPPAPISGSDGPVSVAIGDLNADGYPDLAVANQYKVSVLIGNGSGAFAAAVSYDAGMFPYSVAIGDMNNDGKPDLAVAAAINGTSNVWILPGNGNGTFAAGSGYQAASSPESLAIADLNRDGRLDVATANRLDNNVSVLLNTGACSMNCGAFATGIAHDTNFGSNSTAIGDLNGDGKLDLAVGNEDSHNISVLLGDGTGGFAAAVNYGVGGTFPRTVAIGDLNRDGKLDLVTANRGSDNISILPGNGDGTFAAAVNVAVGDFPLSVAIGDLNGDAKPDLAAGNYGEHTVSILIGNGNGTFAAPVNYDVPYPRAVTLADLNRDGRADLAAASFGGTVEIRLGNGDGTLSALASFGAGSVPWAIAVGDLNRDGKPDLATANAVSDNVSVLLGNGDGTFASSVEYAVVGHPRGVGIGDLNGDGTPDLALATHNTYLVPVLLGNGDGTFAPAVNYENFGTPSITSLDAVAIGDLNADGRADLAVANEDAGKVRVVINACPDLTVQKSHTGTFTRGDTGRTYTLTVNNVSPALTHGPITVTDTLPAGFIAKGLSGTGWTCTLSSLTCTRSDRLSAVAPLITLTVDVRSNAPSNVINTATVSGGNELNTANSTASDPTAIADGGFIAPTAVTATATSPTQISITWDGVANAVSYEVMRIEDLLVTFIPTTSNPFIDTGRTPNKMYIYQVRGIHAAGYSTPHSAFDPATTFSFTDDPVAAGTSIKAVHLTQLQTALNAMRVAVELPATTFRPIAPGAVISAADVNELRSSLDAARAMLSLPAMIYTDPALAPGDTIKAAHIQEIRNALK